MTKAFFWLFLLFLSFHSFGQERGASLEWYRSLLDAKQQPAVEKRLYRSLDEASEAFQNNDPALQSVALKEAGLLYMTALHHYDSAMDFFIRALTIEDSLGLKQQRVFTHLAIAEILERTGNFPGSFHQMEEAWSLNESVGDKAVTVYVLLREAALNAEMGNIEAAFDNFDLALKYEEMLEDPPVRAEILFNRAQLLTSRGDHAKALSDHKEALSLRRKTRDRKNEAFSLAAIGELYRLGRNHEKALANQVVALEIWEELGNKGGAANCYNNAAAVYFEQGNFERSIANLELGLAAAREAQDHGELRRSYDLLSVCYRQLGDFKQSLHYRDLHMAISEFIENERNQQRAVEMQNRYAIAQREAQITRLNAQRAAKEKELQDEKRMRNFLMALIVLGIIIAFLVFYMYLTKRRSNRILRQANETVRRQNVELQSVNAAKDKFFSIISHDLKGPLNSLTSFSSLLINHTDSLSKDEIRMLAKDLDKSLKNLFNLLENLLEWSRSQTGNIDFTPEVFEIGTLITQNEELLRNQAAAKSISISSSSEPAKVTAHRNSVNTVIRNLVSNAIKFTPVGGSIRLSSRVDGSEVIVSVSDTGLGMSQEVIGKLFRLDTKYTTRGTADEKGTGLGLILCREFVEKNGGRIWVESEPGKGSTFHFSLRLEKQKTGQPVA